MSRRPSKHHAILGLDEDVKLHSLPVAKPPKEEGALSFSDYFSDEVPYEVKPVPSVTPMEEESTALKDLVEDIYNQYETRR